MRDLFDNDKVSAVQVRKMIITETLGITVLTVTDISGKMSKRDGWIALLLAVLITFLYTMAVIYINEKCSWNINNFFKNNKNKVLKKVILAVLFIKYFIMTVALINFLVYTVRKHYLNETSVYLVISTIIILGIYGAVQGMEARGRMAQSIYYFIFIPVIIILIMGYKSSRKYYLLPLMLTSSNKIIYTAIILFIVFSPSEMLLVSNRRFQTGSELEISKLKKNIYLSIGIVSLINILYFAVIVGNMSIYEVNGIKNSALIETLRQLKIYGIIFERVDDILLLLLFLSVFMGLIALIYYQIEILRAFTIRKKTKDTKIIYVMMALLLAAFSLGYMSYSERYTNTLFAVEKRTDISDIEYIDSLIIRKNNQHYDVTYIYTNGGEKSEKSKNIQCSSLNEVEYKYLEVSDKKADFSHTKAVIFDENILSDNDMFNQTIKYLWENDELSRNVIIVASKQTNELLKKNETQTEPLGSYLNKYISNNHKSSCCTLFDIKRVYLRAENNLSMMEISLSNDNIIYTGNIIFNSNGMVKIFEDDDMEIDNIVKGRNTGVFKLGNNNSCCVKNADMDLSISKIGDSTIHVKAVYTGEIKDLTEYKTDTALHDTASNSNNERLTSEEFNQIMERLIYDYATQMMNEYKVDILNIYNQLAVYDRQKWILYSDNLSSMFSNVYLEVDASYRLTD